MDRYYAALAMLGFAILLLRVLLGGTGAPRPVARRFLTPREAAMLDALERVLPQYRFHAQVSMGALLKSPRISTGKRRYSDRNAFSQKIVDFVAQDRATGAIVALIEVDDHSHDARRDRDRDRMTAAAGYRTVRIPRSVQPRINEVRIAVGALLVTATAPGRSA